MTDLRADLWAPEVAYAEATGWGTDYRVPSAITAEPLATATVGAAEPSEAVRLTTSLSVSAPGAYEIVVSASGEVTEPRDGPLRNDHLQKSVWIHVRESGGTVADSFQPSLLPAGSLPLPGPYRPSLRAADETMGTSPRPTSGSGQAKIHGYFNEGGTPVSVHGTLLEMHEFEYPGGPVVNVDYALTDANGVATFYCTELYADFFHHLWGQQVKRLDYQLPFEGYCTSPPDTFSINLGAMGRAFLNLEHDIAPSVETAFGESVPTVELAYTGGQCAYSTGANRIELNASSCIWGSGGEFTQSHEFGHALMEKSLGGIPSFEPECYVSHALEEPVGYRCAWGEGFADYVAMSVGHPFPGTSDAYEVGEDCIQVLDCLKVEGAVMAFLNDATDPTNENPHDNITISRSHLADIVRTCEVNDGGWKRADRVHWMIHCIQREVDGYLSGGFPPAQQPTAYSVSSGHSVSATEVRRLWRRQFFYSDELYPVTTLEADIIGPTEVGSGETCMWQADVSGGQPPYSYNWSGAFSGFGETVSGSITSSSRLYLTVTDSSVPQEQDAVELYVQVGTPAECVASP